ELPTSCFDRRNSVAPDAFAAVNDLNPLLILTFVFFFKQTTAYDIGLGIPAEPLFRSVRFQTALASIKLIQASAVLDLTEDDFDFLTSNKVWIATDRSRARRCVEACVYGTLDFVGYPRFPAPVEFI